MSRAGGLGSPVHRLGVQGRCAERAAARCPAESGVVAPALPSIPDTVLQCRTPVLFILLFLSASFLFAVLGRFDPFSSLFFVLVSEF